MDEQTVHAWDERPSDDADFTWHEDGDHWGYGINCDVCHTPNDWHGYDGPAMNIRHLKRQNQDGTTSASEEREALGDRWNDETVGRAR